MPNRDEDAPWLAEAAPLGAAPARPGWLTIAIAVLALGAVAAVALLMLLGRKDGGSTQGYMEAEQAPLIEAEPGPWKVVPLDREGLEVEGDGEVIHEAVRGEDLGSVIDMTAVPEEPIGRPRDLLPPGAGGTAPAAPPLAAPPAQQPAPQPSAAPATQPVPVQIVPPAGAARAVASKPSPAPAVPSPVATKLPPAPAKLPPVASKPSPETIVIVQIGAFSSAAKADEEWQRVAGKAGLSGKQVQQLTGSSGKTLWRVRGRTSDADKACKAILAMKGACEVVKP